jgi:uncharacterized protein (DUF302 family)
VQSSRATFPVTHLRFVTDLPFDEVDASFRRQLGVLDATTLQGLFSGTLPMAAVAARLETISGPTGLCLFGSFDHGRALALDRRPARVVQHLVGNPLVAEKMTRHDLRAGLYAPLRVLIWVDTDNRTLVEYDLPSSLFGQLGNAQVDAVAAELDRKLEAVVKAAVG